jgi:asparagine synthase (glutamine-hydrolysing)
VSTPQFLKCAQKGVAFPELEQDRELIDRFDPLTRRLYMDFHYYTLPNILQNFDRASMAHGVEIRAPFLDWRLVCYAHALPWSAKINHGYSKYLVRDALQTSMPTQIVHRRTKLGFIAPIEAWVRGPLGEFIQDQVASRSFLEEPLWDGPALRTVAEEAVALGDGPTVRRVWPFVQADMLQNLFRASSNRNVTTKLDGAPAPTMEALPG